MARIIYRDKKTGRFTKRATWKRSKAKNGKRYVRERILSKPKKRRREREEEEEFEDIELVGGFDSPGGKRKKR